MDKLPEPEFTPDTKWRRLLHGTEPLLAESDTSFYKYFGVLTAGSIYKYWREITFYKKNYPQFLAIAGLFTFSSYQLAKFMTEDAYVLAAVKNNEAENEYIGQYKNLYKEAKAKNVVLPGNLIH